MGGRGRYAASRAGGGAAGAEPRHARLSHRFEGESDLPRGGRVRVQLLRGRGSRGAAPVATRGPVGRGRLARPAAVGGRDAREPQSTRAAGGPEWTGGKGR